MSEDYTSYFTKKKRANEPKEIENKDVFGFRVPNLVEILKGEFDEAIITGLSGAKN
jgi:hypothetical protein